MTELVSYATAGSSETGVAELAIIRVWPVFEGGVDGDLLLFKAKYVPKPAAITITT